MQHDPASRLIFLLSKQGSLLIECFPKNLSLQADAQPSSSRGSKAGLSGGPWHVVYVPTGDEVVRARAWVGFVVKLVPSLAYYAFLSLCLPSPVTSSMSHAFARLSCLYFHSPRGCGPCMTSRLGGCRCNEGLNVNLFTTNELQILSTRYATIRHAADLQLILRAKR